MGEGVEGRLHGFLGGGRKLERVSRGGCMEFQDKNVREVKGRLQVLLVGEFLLGVVVKMRHHANYVVICLKWVNYNQLYDHLTTALLR